MRITIIGTGYVGLVTGACLAEYGNHVLCLDVDASKIAALRKGDIPIYEPGLAEMVRRNFAAGRLQFCSDIEESVAHGPLQFICVGTPPAADGTADLQQVMHAARHIGQYMTDYTIIVNKSTVPVGTADKVEAAIQSELDSRNVQSHFSVVSNPEFLKEGAAIDDFMRPDRIVIGSQDSRAREWMQRIYAPFVRNHDRILYMDTRSAELTKYAANAMLATRISFMNELANLSEKIGADIELVRQGIGADPRIGYHFLYPGMGYGGSCFPKDVLALQRTANEYGQSLEILHAVDDVNRAQKNILVRKVTAHYGEDLHGFHFALWGLAFKPNTDDMRDAPSRVIIDGLLARGATITAYDPIAMPQARQCIGERSGLYYSATQGDALPGADALLIATEWKAFRSPDFKEIKALLNQPVIFDGRNLYDPQQLKIDGFCYYSVGRSDAYTAHLKPERQIDEVHSCITDIASQPELPGTRTGAATSVPR